VSRPFTVLKWSSFAHSAVYAALLVAAFSGADTTALGWAHGLGWIAMSIACLVAVHRRWIPLGVAVAVVVIGGIGPFVGSLMFVREARRREWVG
jgi:hypothetical protein